MHSSASVAFSSLSQPTAGQLRQAEHHHPFLADSLFCGRHVAERKSSSRKCVKLISTLGDPGREEMMYMHARVNDATGDNPGRKAFSSACFKTMPSV